MPSSCSALSTSAGRSTSGMRSSTPWYLIRQLRAAGHGTCRPAGQADHDMCTTLLALPHCWRAWMSRLAETAASLHPWNQPCAHNSTKRSGRHLQDTCTALHACMHGMCAVPDDGALHRGHVRAAHAAAHAAAHLRTRCLMSQTGLSGGVCWCRKTS